MKNKYSYLLILASLFILPHSAFAVGSAAFENASFSARSLAEGNSVTAQADEPAAISYNPAGITQLPGIQVQGNIAFISTFTRQSFNNAVMYSSGTLNAVPTGYVTINPGKLLGDRVAFGIGSDSPFGLSNKYDSNDPPVHYTGWNNYLKMFTIKPVMAVKVTDWLSIGAGPMWYRIFKFGGIQAYPNQLLGAPFPDGQARVDLKGNSWGWQIGALLRPFKKHQFGFYFRSPVNLLLKGQAKVENATIGNNFGTGAWAKLNLPLNFTFAYAFKPTKRTTVEMDFGYTRWSTHKRLYINTDPVDAANDAILQAIGKADKDYRDGFALSLGGNHQFTDRFTLRGGSWFYWYVVPQNHFIPAVPDSNRLGLSVGGSYQICKNLVFDLAYLTIFGLRRNINNDIAEGLGTSVDGKYFSFTQEFAFSLTYKFDDLFKKKHQNQIVENAPIIQAM